MGNCWIKRNQSTNIYGSFKLSATIAPFSSPPYELSNNFQLFGHELCPLTACVRIALLHKGVNVNPKWVSSQDLKTESKERTPLDCPSGRLPVLQHGEKRLCGSLDEIIEYIEATVREPPLLFKGDLEKNVKGWTDYVRDTFSPLIEDIVYQSNPYVQQDLETQLNAAFAKLDSGIWQRSNEGPYFLGKNFSLVDVYLIPFLELLHPLAYFRGIEVNDVHFHLLGYIRRMVSFPSYAPLKMDVELLLISAAKSLADKAPTAVVTVIILQHRSILWHMEKLIELADELAVAKRVVPTLEINVRRLCNVYGQLIEVMQEHAQMEERVIFPAIEKAARGVTARSNEDHARDLLVMNRIREDIKSVMAIDPCSPMYNEALLALAIRLRIFQAYTVNHFQEEEKELLPLLEITGLRSKEQASLTAKCMTIMVSSHTHLLPYVLLGLRVHEIHQYLSTIQKCFENDARSTFFKTMILSVKNAEEEFACVWKVVECRFPSLAASWSISHEN